MNEIKILRKSKLLTQYEVAEKLQIDKSYYCNIENGKIMPSIKVIKRLAKVLKATPQEVNECLQRNFKKGE